MENLCDMEFEDLNYDEINRESFRDILVKYDMQSYSDMFIEYQVIWQHLQGLLKKGRKKHENKDKNLRPHALKVSRILKMFFSRETARNSNLEVSVSDIHYKIDIAGDELLSYLKESFIKEFERLGLNETELSTEEAIAEIENGGDREWFDDHGYDYEEKPVDPEVVEEYRLVHSKPRETSFEMVNNVLSEIEMIQEKRKKGSGAKVKNLGFGELAKRLSYLHRIHQFLDQVEFSSIKDFPLSNETCRFIYEYFDFWNLLTDHVRFDKNDKEKRANYIKALIRNNEKYFRKGFSYNSTLDHIYFYDDNLELMIDLFKQAKNGLISPEEFHERMSSLQK